MERQPHLEVRVEISVSLTDFARENVDVATRSGRGGYPGMQTDLLMEENFFPVCSAALLGDPARPLHEPSDLRHHTLLHEIPEGTPDFVTWPRWLAAVGEHEIDATRGPRFSPTFLALQAAASGQGVAVATNVLIGDFLDAGRLVRPFAHQVSPRRPHKNQGSCWVSKNPSNGICVVFSKSSIASTRRER